MYRKASIILVLFTACSLFQQDEQAVVSVADTDKGKEAIASGVQLTDEREEISDEDAPLVLVQCVNESATDSGFSNSDEPPRGKLFSSAHI